MKKTKKAENVVRIIYENPPFAETTNIEFQKLGIAKEQSGWRNSFVVKNMKKYIASHPIVEKQATREMGNAFIWSGFEYILKSPYDSQIAFSPAKYYKCHHLVNKKFINGYAFNRNHFHANIDACIMAILWSNEESESVLGSFKVHAVDLDNDNNYIDEGMIDIIPIKSTYNDKYVDNQPRKGDYLCDIICEYNGTQKLSGKIYTKGKNNPDIIGYLVADSTNFDNPDLHSLISTCALYTGSGQYLYRDNFIEKLPLFAASRYVSYNRHWTERGRIMKSADGADEFFKDVKNGTAQDFLTKCLIFTCFEPRNHARSFYGSDGRLYLNQMCFDTNTTASQKMKELLDNGYVLSQEEENLFNDWKTILTRAKTVYGNGECRYPYHDGIGYNPDFTYGLYQIDQEVNFKIEKGFDRTGKPKKVFNDGDLNNMIKRFKTQVKSYYLNNLVEPLFHYQFLK